MKKNLAIILLSFFLVFNIFISKILKQLLYQKKTLLVQKIVGKNLALAQENPIGQKKDFVTLKWALTRLQL